jgi:hypothetical protein
MYLKVPNTYYSLSGHLIIPRDGLWHRLTKQDKDKGAGDKVKQDHGIQVWQES